MIYVTRVTSDRRQGLDLNVVDVGQTHAPSLEVIDSAVLDLLARKGIANDDAVVLPVKMMQVPEFKAAQDEQRYAPHVKPINMMVNQLVKGGERGWMPWVAAWQGGVNARVLAISRDPGPKAKESQYLCMQNADESAAGMTLLAAQAGLTAADLCPWNCYPWYINRKPTAVEARAGIAPLVKLTAMMGNLEAVLLHGSDAQGSWDRLVAAEPSLGARFTERNVFRTFHSGNQALQVREPERTERRNHRIATYQRLAAFLAEDPSREPDPRQPAADSSATQSPGTLLRDGATVVASERGRLLTVSASHRPYVVSRGGRAEAFDDFQAAIAAFNQP